ncbi:hypothetical protein BVRB_3g054670 isoform A [Beta vulgaris subsp. vulgaris]|nr:hypothetical protein BVRB_3g054670 isoform A [Beta vulgaris subsp. vulgaris]
MEHGPQSSDGKFASGNLSTSIESKLPKKQADLTQTPNKQSDPSYRLYGGRTWLRGL